MSILKKIILLELFEQLCGNMLICSRKDRKDLVWNYVGYRNV